MEKLSSVEGYFASAATGLLVGLNASRQMLEKTISPSGRNSDRRSWGCNF